MRVQARLSYSSCEEGVLVFAPKSSVLPGSVRTDQYTAADCFPSCPSSALEPLYRALFTGLCCASSSRTEAVSRSCRVSAEQLLAMRISPCSPAALLRDLLCLSEELHPVRASQGLAWLPEPSLGCTQECWRSWLRLWLSHSLEKRGDA